MVQMVAAPLIGFGRVSVIANGWFTGLKARVSCLPCTRLSQCFDIQWDPLFRIQYEKNSFFFAFTFAYAATKTFLADHITYLSVAPLKNIAYSKHMHIKTGIGSALRIDNVPI